MADKDRTNLAALVRVLGPVLNWAARIDSDAVLGRPPPGSVLAIDDAEAFPYQLSDAAWHSLSHAVDHLSCLRALVADAHLIHMYAPYSLIRSAPENACAAVWLLQPDDRTERIIRRLRMASDDICQDEEVKRLTGQPGPRSQEDRLSQVRRIAASAGADETVAVRKANYAEIVGAASAELDLPPHTIYLSLKLCSGITHGDLWATFSGTTRVQLPGAPEGIGAFKISANVGLLMRLTAVAVRMTGRGWKLYDQRSRPA